MITFLTIPRPFTGEFDTLQRMAIASWQESTPGCNVILFGDDAEIRESGAPKVQNTYQCIDSIDGEYGPACSGVFEWAEQYANRQWLCFCSADVVLDFNAAALLRLLSDIDRPFVIGQRWDIEPDAAPGTAKLHPPCGVDYFLYRKGTIGDVLPFCVRGGGSDNWMVWKALTAWNMTVIDATNAIFAIHVNHSHPAWPNGKAGRQGSPEQAYNRKLYEADGMTTLLGVDAAPWVIRDGKLGRRSA